MNLFDILVLLAILAFGYQFWRLRAMAEYANLYLTRYCDKHQLQLLDVARTHTRLSWQSGKLDWQCEFRFAFSGNGEDAQTGHLYMQGIKVVETQLPAYRIN